MNEHIYEVLLSSNEIRFLNEISIKLNHKQLLSENETNKITELIDKVNKFKINQDDDLGDYDNDD